MNTSLIACYLETVFADPLALFLSLTILGFGYLLFGLEPSPPQDQTDSDLPEPASGRRL